jgi:hypothetical protein
MNHLRELIEALPGRVGVDPKLSSHPRAPQLLEALTAVKSRAEQATCFSLGDIDRLLEISVIGDLCRLPYPTCWFEATVFDSNEKGWSAVLGVLATQSGAAITGTVFARENNLGWTLEGAYQIDPTKPAGTEVVWRGPDETGPELRMMAGAMMSFLSALHCSNVQRQEHPADAKLQKARTKRGKAPLFSYWTLQLDGKSDRGESQGGTHASPRVHLRRGHPRQYAPGLWTWVQPCAVGNRSAGMVHKDYSAGPALLVPAR